MTDLSGLPCPFNSCDARPGLVEIKEHPDSDRMIRVVISHTLQPNPEYGTCPASLMTVPLSQHAQDALTNEAARVGRFRGDAGLPKREPGGATPAVPTHSKTPDPSRGSDRWFRAGQTGDNPRGEHGPLGYQRMPMGVTPGADMGRGMASVAEVRATLDRARQLLAEGQAAAQATAQQYTEATATARAARDKFNEAHALLQWVKQDSASEVGSAHALAASMSAEDSTETAARAAQECTAAMQYASIAIEEAGTYGASL